ncbi:hypothetical protein [Streptomyces sp. NPDC048521]|uniref:LexA family protein n=1 Tax=Streptomyces sp. NPDC048521 TaxID=3365566 RepID=UPI00371A3876
MLTPPEGGVPLLFVEIDHCYGSAQVLAAKIDTYMRFCRRKVKDADGMSGPMWRTRWWVPDGRHGDQPHPLLLLVFDRVGPRNPNTVIARLAELARRHRQGTAHDGFHLYDGKLPVVVTGMKQLKEHGPAGAIFRRFGRPQNQTLLEAIGNPRREAHDARQWAEHEARERAYKEQLRRVARERAAGRETRLRILRCIRRHIADHGEAPTMRQIGQAVGMRSRASVHYQLVELEAKCAIVREPGQWRGIRLA